MVTVAWFVERFGQEQWDYLLWQKDVKESLRLSWWTDLLGRLEDQLTELERTPAEGDE